MCSIMGYCSCDIVLEKFQAAFSRTLSRGPDDSRIRSNEEGLLAFHRLAVMGLTPAGMQPFERYGSAVVCNGEIYGFETLKKELKRIGYTFRSGSDCETLLPLYPGQSEMITDFWMPNKSWEGCDVDDLSARVLKNYGDSGK